MKLLKGFCIFAFVVAITLPVLFCESDDDDDDPDEENECIGDCREVSVPCHNACEQEMVECSNWYSPDELDQCNDLFDDCSMNCASDDTKELWLCVIDCNMKINQCEKESMESV